MSGILSHEEDQEALNADILRKFHPLMVDGVIASVMRGGKDEHGVGILPPRDQE